MARPRKEGMEYFPHDTDARNDLKIRKLRAVFGNDGYATYFILLENIYRNKSYSIDVSDTETMLILAEECKISEEKLSEIVLKCCDLDLFSKAMYQSDKLLTSEGIKKRTEPIENKRKKNNESYNTSKVEVSDAETIAEIDISDAEKGAESTQSKVENRKENNSKENNIISMSAEQTPYEDIKDLFNSICVTLPKIKSITANRQKTVKARWRENPSIEFFRELFNTVNNSSFLRGDEKWKNNCFDWIMTPSNMQKILEGNYDNRKAANLNDWMVQ